MAQPKLDELLAAYSLLQNGGLEGLGESVLSPTKGKGMSLEDILKVAQEPKGPQETTSQFNIPGLLSNFTNQEYGPHATGVPYIFTGGSPFPRTKGQIQGGQLAARMALLNNILDSMGAITKSTVPQIIDMIKKKKKGQGNAG